MTSERVDLLAEADYGTDLVGHRDALATMVSDRVVAPRLSWIPGEVIRLSRFDRGERVDHVVRAFCATVLLMYGENAATNAAILLESIFTLDAVALPRAIALLVHHHECEDTIEPTMLYAIALLAARARCSAERIDAVLDTFTTTLPSGGIATSLCARLATTGAAPQWKSVSAAIAAETSLPTLVTLAAAVAAMETR
jgi:hypothetical protein